MQLRLTSLILVVIVGSGTLTGVPFRFAEQTCSMDHVMGDMACCDSALLLVDNAQAATARLCCALNCAQEGTAPVKVARFAPQLQLTDVSYRLVAQTSLTPHFRHRQFDSSHGPPNDSHPAYLRNLALLI